MVDACDTILRPRGDAAPGDDSNVDVCIVIPAAARKPWRLVIDYGPADVPDDAAPTAANGERPMLRRGRFSMEAPWEFSVKKWRMLVEAAGPNFGYIDFSPGVAGGPSRVTLEKDASTDVTTILSEAILRTPFELVFGSRVSFPGADIDAQLLDVMEQALERGLIST